MINTPLASTAVGVVSVDRSGMASGINSTLRQVGVATGIAVLGTLFSSMAYIKHETDLVIIVTPHLVQPAVPGQRMASPLDERLPSNDVDFFLLGRSEVKKDYTDFINRGGALQGPYGHIVGEASLLSKFGDQLALSLPRKLFRDCSL